jgi:hypothetical protein
MLKLSISTDGRRDAPWAAMPVVVVVSSAIVNLEKPPPDGACINSLCRNRFLHTLRLGFAGCSGPADAMAANPERYLRPTESSLREETERVNRVP